MKIYIIEFLKLNSGIFYNNLNTLVVHQQGHAESKTLLEHNLLVLNEVTS